LSKAILALEDGTVFEGRGFGALAERCGEVVFNTAITGYQEVFTDPSYSGQIVVLTYPEIGNYGTTPDDNEADRPYIEGLVVREFSAVASNWRSREHANEFLAAHGIPVIAEIDTRGLVRKLRTSGVMRGIISGTGGDPKELVEKARRSPSMAGLDLATRVSTAKAYTWESPVEPCSPSEDVGSPAESLYNVVAYDFGIKRSIVHLLGEQGFRLTLVPANTSAKEGMRLRPDGVFLSNGPGDPAAVTYAVKAVARLVGQTPIFGICLGHQLIGRALGAGTCRLAFGHHGGNHPVQHLPSGRVLNTAQNHNYCVQADNLDPNEVEVTYSSLNDGSLEGFRLKRKPVLSVQFHPEAAPGPHDAHGIFREFFHMIDQEVCHA